jgi:hypothetical protein
VDSAFRIYHDARVVVRHRLLATTLVSGTTVRGFTARNNDAFVFFGLVSLGFIREEGVSPANA